MSYFLVLDVGTTNVKALAFSKEGNLLESLEEKPKMLYPQHGWVEEDPIEVIEIIYRLIGKVEGKYGKPLGLVLTNQRSSTILWDNESGEPLYNMITWQDTRTNELVEQFSSQFMVRLGNTLGKTLRLLSKPLPFIKRTKKGAYLVTLAYISFGTTHPSLHIRWLMDNVEGVKSAIQRKEAFFGTLDSWIAWNLTGKHVTDYTNASATGIFDPFYLKWSDNIMKIVGIPRSILPRFVPNNSPIGEVKDYDVPLLTMIADQQASLYMAGVSKGTAKMTNGTGTFIDLNVGERPYPGNRGLYPMVALETRNKTLYLLEGSVITSGSAVDWLISVGLMEDYSEISKAFDHEGEEVIFIPALSGLGTPHIKPEVKGAIFGITRGTKREDIIRGLITGIAMRCGEIIKFIENSSGIRLSTIVADGGLSNSDELLQLVADFSGKEILRPIYLNGSAYGAYMLAKAVYEKKDVITAREQPMFDEKFAPRRDTKNLKEEWKKRIAKLIEMS